MSYPDHSETHGGIDPGELKALGIAPENLVDFSVNSNPFGPAPNVLEALRGVDVSAYPDRKCSRLRELLAAHNHVSYDEVLVGNGTAEIIYLILHALVKAGEAVLIIGPTFGEYRRAAEAVGANVREVRAQSPDFQPPLDDALAIIQKERPRLVFLCNPNNPSGKYLPSGLVHDFLHAMPDGTLVVLDEAYRAFIDGVFFGSLPRANCILMRSMTKDFALAGLRLGYVLANAQIIQQMQPFQPAWSVNVLAQAAGITALNELAYYRETLHELRHLRIGFFAAMRASGFTLVESQTHFALVQGEQPAREIRLRLLRKGIQVRDCASFGLPQSMRVSTRLPGENQKLLQALREIKIEMGA